MDLKKLFRNPEGTGFPVLINGDFGF